MQPNRCEELSPATARCSVSTKVIHSHTRLSGRPFRGSGHFLGLRLSTTKSPEVEAFCWEGALLEVSLAGRE